MGMTTQSALESIHRCDENSLQELANAPHHLDGGMLLRAAITLTVDDKKKKSIRAQMIVLLIKKYPTYRTVLDSNRNSPIDIALMVKDFSTVMHLLFATMRVKAVIEGLIKLGPDTKATAQALLKFIKAEKYTLDHQIFLKTALIRELKSSHKFTGQATPPVVPLVVTHQDIDSEKEEEGSDDNWGFEIIDSENNKDPDYPTLKSRLNSAIDSLKDLELQHQLKLLIPILEKIYKELGGTPALLQLLVASLLLCKEFKRNQPAKEKVAQQFSVNTINAIQILEGNDQNTWFGLRLWLMNFINKLCGHTQTEISNYPSDKRIGLTDAYKLGACTQHITNTVHPNTQPSISFFKPALG